MSQSRCQNRLDQKRRTRMACSKGLCREHAPQVRMTRPCFLLRLGVHLARPHSTGCKSEILLLSTESAQRPRLLQRKRNEDRRPLQRHPLQAPGSRSQASGLRLILRLGMRHPVSRVVEHSTHCKLRVWPHSRELPTMLVCQPAHNRTLAQRDLGLPLSNLAAVCTLQLLSIRVPIRFIPVQAHRWRSQFLSPQCQRDRQTH